MNKLLLASLLTIFFATSCYERAVKKDKSNEVPLQAVTEVPQVKTKFKSDIRRELEGSFTHFKQDGVEEVSPKYLTSKKNGVYCYFFIRNKKALSLKLHIEYSDYYAADLYELVANGETISYEANVKFSPESSLPVAESTDFQWYDKGINLSDEEFLRKTENATDAVLNFKIKDSDALLGSVKLTKEEFQSLLKTIEYYKSLDGAKIPKKGMVNIRG